MALQRKFEERQWPLVAEGTIRIGADSAVNTSGATVAFNATAGTVYDLIQLPPNAVVIDGEVVVEVVSNDASTATIAVGDSVSATRYLSATSTKALGRTAMALTGYRSNGEDIRITLANAGGGATTGTVTVRAVYVVKGRCNEVQPS